MVEIVLALVAFGLAIWFLNRDYDRAEPDDAGGVPALYLLDEQLLDYMAARGLEFLCCEFAALYLLKIDPKTPGKDLTPEQRSAIAALIPDIEEAADRIVTTGVLKPHEEIFQFTDVGVTTPTTCRTPGLYSVTDAGRRALRRRPVAGLESRE